MIDNRAIMEKIEQSAQLVSLPQIYLRLKELLSEPDFTMAEVSLLVSRDPALAARFLRVVNSPLNRRARKIESVSHAVSLLGSKQVHDIALFAAVAEAFDKIETDVVNVKQFWQRSVFCAMLAQQLALAAGEMATDRLFMMGLLHDIGHMFMYLAIPEESQQTTLKAKELKRPLFLLEQETLGFDYAQVGADVMQNWEFPKSFQLTTRHHPEPGQASQFQLETALVHLSSLLVGSYLEAEEFGYGRFVADETVWSTTGLTEQQCLDALQSATDNYVDVTNCLFP